MADERDGIVKLVDDEGKEVEFEYITTIEMDDKVYLVLHPVDAEEDEEVIILKVEKSEDGEDNLVTLEEEEEEKVFEEFNRLIEEEYEFEE